MHKIVTSELSCKDAFMQLIHAMQDDICLALESTDGLAKFKEDIWTRQEGGGGKTRIIANGSIFEKGGVNTSVVHGLVTDTMRKQLQIDGHSWFAGGISSVIHPINPFVPTIHFNYRYFEMYDAENKVTDSWFGGGADITPFYLFESDIIHFHQSYKDACNKVDSSLYPKFKQQCDNYFVNTHRNNERRGVGGIFYDHMRAGDDYSTSDLLKLASHCGYAFLEAYLPIVAARKSMSYTAQHKYWQEIRRGRYTEFNLIHDRGTLFGLKTNGRTASILMSLPPTVRFDYDFEPQPHSQEAILLDACLHPKQWI